MTPEMLTKFNELRKKNKPKESIPTYKEYYNKRFLEECKYFIENPKFSMKYMMVMTQLQKNIKEKSLKEYKEKYPGALINDIYEIDQKDETIQTDKTNQKSNNRAPYSRSIIQIPKHGGNTLPKREGNTLPKRESNTLPKRESNTLPKIDNQDIIDYDIIDIPNDTKLRRSDRIKSKLK